MRIPEPLFKFINIIVKLLLRSPLHGLMSNSIMLIHYTGRKSGKQYSTPVRYMEIDGGLRCFTAEHVQWWRNVQVNPQVVLRVAGNSHPYNANVLERDANRTRELLTEFLAIHPQDAVYQDIGLNKDGSLNEKDLVAASNVAIVVDFYRQ